MDLVSLFTEDQLYIFSIFILSFLIPEVELSLRASNVKYFRFALENTSCNIQLFMKTLFCRNSVQFLKLGVHYLVTLTKTKYLEFSLVLVLLVLKVLFLWRKIYFSVLYQYLAKQKEKQKLLQKARQSFLSLKTFFQRSECLFQLNTT